MMAILTQKLSGTGYPRLAVLDTDRRHARVWWCRTGRESHRALPDPWANEIAVFQPGVFDFVVHTVVRSP